ncbi:MAG: S8 family serine peptidase, partial [Betaproteobacteria bacterium]|nr:S8 family serine peptidase [Betaproteobacteria bacterium]
MSNWTPFRSRLALWIISICSLTMSGGALADPGDAPELPVIKKRAALPVQHLIVKMAGGAEAARNLVPPQRFAVSLDIAPQVDFVYQRELATGASLLRLAEPLPVESARALAAQLARAPGVEYAEADEWAFPLRTPNDAQAGTQWHLNDAFGGVNAAAAWDITTGSAATVVAVVDSGSRPHRDQLARLVPGYDFITNVDRANDGDARDPDPTDPGDWVTSAEKTANTLFTNCDVENSSWHGTSVAGVIGAETNNGLDVAGLDWNARILPMRALGKCGGSSSDIAEAMLWAAGIAVAGIPENTNPAKVINLSLGSQNTCSNTYRTAINQILAAGKIVVASAGNDNNDLEHSPSSCPGVISVGAVNRVGAKASYSSFGSRLTLMAPGGDGGDLITLGNSGTTTPSADIVRGISGTSFSAPVVSGIVSLMLAIRPDLESTEVTRILQASVRPFPDSSCNTAICGAGILDAAAAVRATRDLSLGVATMISFQDTDVGRPGADLLLKVTNLSNAPIGISPTVQFVTADFSLGSAQPGFCIGLTLQPNASCSIPVRFNPTSPGLKNGTMQFQAGDGRFYSLSLAGYAYGATNITETATPASAAPLYIAKGADGNYWYTIQPPTRSDAVVRMRPNGETTEFAVSDLAGGPFDIAAGADGNMWFTLLNAGKIGRITPEGVLTEFVLPDTTAQPRGIALGPDGNMWFTQIVNRRIGRITPTGTITEFTAPWTATPRGIVAGPDGAMWFTDSGGLSIGRVTMQGTFTRFVIPWTSGSARGIALGSDGNLWFAENTGNRVGRITPSGAFTEFPMVRAGTNPLHVAAGPDGGVWFSANSANRIGRIDTATGQVSEFRIPTAGSSPIGIVEGANRQMWFVGNTSNKIAKLSIAGVSGSNVYTDLWWAGQSENGWGVTINQHGNVQFNLLFVYDNAGRPAWYAMPGCTWNADFTSCNGALYKPTSAPLNNYNPAQFAVGPAVGSVTFQFTGPDTALMQYVINGVAGQKSITRQSFGVPDSTPGLQVGDMWWAGDAQNGWGLSITQQQRNLFGAWYTYDAGGATTWFVMPAGTWTGNSYAGK